MLGLMYSVKRAGLFGGGGWLYVLRESPLWIPLFIPLIFMIIGMRSEAVGTLGGWRGALLMGVRGGVGGALAVLFSVSFFFSSPGLHFFGQRHGPCWNCPSSDLSPGARLERPSRLNPSALSHPPRLPGLFTAKALQHCLCCGSLKRWRP